jgi:hypothetical protein
MKNLKYVIGVDLQNKLFNDYIYGKIRFTPTQNIWMNDHSEDWYVLIGEYFIKSVGYDFLKNDPFSIDDNGKIDSNKRCVGILFITSYLNEKNLKKMFGNPIKHSEFGEGFDRKRNYEYCSYIVQIDGKYFHIGYDHRGTSIECECDLNVKELFEIIKKLIDYFKEVVK